MLGGRKRQMARLPWVCVFTLSPHSSGERRASGSEKVFTPQVRCEGPWFLWSVWRFST